MSSDNSVFFEKGFLVICICWMVKLICWVGGNLENSNHFLLFICVCVCVPACATCMWCEHMCASVCESENRSFVNFI
jgi:hypothetical protein